MKGNFKLGTTLAIVGILTTVLLIILLASIYMPTVDGKILDERPDEAITVRIVFALLGWVGMTAGALWIVVLYGFQNNKGWAWGWGSVAAMAQIVAGFFPIIPPASIGMAFPTIWVFLIAFALWFGMLFIGGVQKKIFFLAFFSAEVIRSVVMPPRPKRQSMSGFAITKEVILDSAVVISRVASMISMSPLMPYCFIASLIPELLTTP